MTGPAVLHAATEAVQHSLLPAHQVQVEASSGGGVVGYFPQSQTDRGRRPGEFLDWQSLVVPAEADAAPGKSPTGSGELPPLGLTLRAGHEGVDHHLVPRHNAAVVAASFREVGPHPVTALLSALFALLISQF